MKSRHHKQNASQDKAAADQQVSPTQKDTQGPDPTQQIRWGSLFEKLTKKSMKTESSVPGVCQTDSALCYLEKENPTFCSGTAPLSTAWASETCSYFTFVSTVSKRDLMKIKKANLPLAAQMCSRVCHCYAAGRILPSCLCPDGHLVRKKHFVILWCWNLPSLLPHLPVVKDPESSQDSARKSWQKHSWFHLGGNQGHNPTTNLVALAAWENTFAGAKGQELETCSRRKTTHTHTPPPPFQTQGTAGLWSRHQHSSPDHSSGPTDTEEQQPLTPTASPKETVWQGREQPNAKITSS